MDRNMWKDQTCPVPVHVHAGLFGMGAEVSSHTDLCRGAVPVPSLPYLSPLCARVKKGWFFITQGRVSAGGFLSHPENEVGRQCRVRAW